MKKKLKGYNVMIQILGFDDPIVVTENPVSRAKAKEYAKVVSMTFRALYNDDHMKPGIHSACVSIVEEE